MAGAAKIEAHGVEAGFAQGALGHRHHLVVHAAAFGGQRMADHGHGAARVAGLGYVGERLQLAGRAAEHETGGLVGKRRRDQRETRGSSCRA
jgi:hypothetical protein